MPGRRADRDGERGLSEFVEKVGALLLAADVRISEHG